MQIQDIKIAIIGRGYVGLPLAVEFGIKQHVVGFDINKKRINELKTGMDVTLEQTKYILIAALKVQVQQFSKGNCLCQELTNTSNLRKEL